MSEQDACDPMSFKGQMAARYKERLSMGFSLGTQLNAEEGKSVSQELVVNPGQKHMVTETRSKSSLDEHYSDISKPTMKDLITKFERRSSTTKHNNSSGPDGINLTSDNWEDSFPGINMERDPSTPSSSSSSDNVNVKSSIFMPVLSYGKAPSASINLSKCEINAMQPMNQDNNSNVPELDEINAKQPRNQDNNSNVPQLGEINAKQPRNQDNNSNVPQLGEINAKQPRNQDNNINVLQLGGISTVDYQKPGNDKVFYTTNTQVNRISERVNTPAQLANVKSSAGLTSCSVNDTNILANAETKSLGNSSERATEEPKQKLNEQESVMPPPLRVSLRGIAARKKLNAGNKYIVYKKDWGAGSPVPKQIPGGAALTFTGSETQGTKSILSSWRDRALKQKSGVTLKENEGFKTVQLSRQSEGEEVKNKAGQSMIIRQKIEKKNWMQQSTNKEEAVSYDEKKGSNTMERYLHLLKSSNPTQSQHSSTSLRKEMWKAFRPPTPHYSSLLRSRKGSAASSKTNFHIQKEIDKSNIVDDSAPNLQGDLSEKRFLDTKTRAEILSKRKPRSKLSKMNAKELRAQASNADLVWNLSVSSSNSVISSNGEDLCKQEQQISEHVPGFSVPPYVTTSLDTRNHVPATVSGVASACQDVKATQAPNVEERLTDTDQKDKPLHQLMSTSFSLGAPHDLLKIKPSRLQAVSSGSESSAFSLMPDKSTYAHLKQLTNAADRTTSVITTATADAWSRLLTDEELANNELVPEHIRNRNIRLLREHLSQLPAHSFNRRNVESAASKQALPRLVKMTRTAAASEKAAVIDTLRTQYIAKKQKLDTDGEYMKENDTKKRGSSAQAELADYSVSHRVAEHSVTSGPELIVKAEARASIFGNKRLPFFSGLTDENKEPSKQLTRPALNLSMTEKDKKWSESEANGQKNPFNKCSVVQLKHAESAMVFYPPENTSDKTSYGLVWENQTDGTTTTSPLKKKRKVEKSKKGKKKKKKRKEDGDSADTNSTNTAHMAAKSGKNKEKHKHMLTKKVSESSKETGDGADKSQTATKTEPPELKDGSKHRRKEQYDCVEKTEMKKLINFDKSDEKMDRIQKSSTELSMLKKDTRMSGDNSISVKLDDLQSGVLCKWSQKEADIRLKKQEKYLLKREGSSPPRQALDSAVMEEWAMHCWQPFKSECLESHLCWNTSFQTQPEQILETQLGDVHGGQTGSADKKYSQAVADQTDNSTRSIYRDEKSRGIVERQSSNITSRDSTEIPTWCESYSPDNPDHGKFISLDLDFLTRNVKVASLDHISDTPRDLLSKSTLPPSQVMSMCFIRVVCACGKHICSVLRCKCWEVLTSGRETRVPTSDVLADFKRAGHKLREFSFDASDTDKVKLYSKFSLGNPGTAMTHIIYFILKDVPILNEFCVENVEVKTDQIFSCKEKIKTLKMFSLLNTVKLKAQYIFFFESTEDTWSCVWKGFVCAGKMTLSLCPTNYLGKVSALIICFGDKRGQFNTPKLCSPNCPSCWPDDANNNSNSSLPTEGDDDNVSDILAMPQYLTSQASPKTELLKISWDKTDQYMHGEQHDSCIKHISGHGVSKRSCRQPHDLRCSCKRRKMPQCASDLATSRSHLDDKSKIDHPGMMTYSGRHESEATYQVRDTRTYEDMDISTAAVANSPFIGVSSVEGNGQILGNDKCFSHRQVSVINDACAGWNATLCSNSWKVSIDDKSSESIRSTSVKAIRTSCAPIDFWSNQDSLTPPRRFVNYGAGVDTGERNNNSKDQNSTYIHCKTPYLEAQMQHGQSESGLPPHVVKNTNQNPNRRDKISGHHVGASQRRFQECTKAKMFHRLRACRHQEENIIQSTNRALQHSNDKMKWMCTSATKLQESQNSQAGETNGGHVIRKILPAEVKQYRVHKVGQRSPFWVKSNHQTNSYNGHQRKKWPGSDQAYLSPGVPRCHLRMSPAASRLSFRTANATEENLSCRYRGVNYCHYASTNHGPTVVQKEESGNTNTRSKDEYTIPEKFLTIYQGIDDTAENLKSHGSRDLSHSDIVKTDAIFKVCNASRETTVNKNYKPTMRVQTRSKLDIISETNYRQSDPRDTTYHRQGDSRDTTHHRQGDGVDTKSNCSFKFDDTDTCRTTSTWNEDTTWSRSLRRDCRKPQGKSNFRNLNFDPKLAREMQKKVEMLVKSYRDFLEKEAERRVIEGKTWDFDDIEAGDDVRRDGPGGSTSDQITHIKGDDNLFSLPVSDGRMTCDQDMYSLPKDFDNVQENPNSEIGRQYLKPGKSKVNKKNSGLVTKQRLSELTQDRFCGSAVKGWGSDSLHARTTTAGVPENKSQPQKMLGTDAKDNRLSILTKPSSHRADLYDDLSPGQTTSRRPVYDLILSYSNERGDVERQNVTCAQHNLGSQPSAAEEGSQCFTFVIDNDGNTYRHDTVSCLNARNLLLLNLNKDLKVKSGNYRPSRIPVFIGKNNACRNIRGHMYDMSEYQIRHGERINKQSCLLSKSKKVKRQSLLADIQKMPNGTANTNTFSDSLSKIPVNMSMCRSKQTVNNKSVAVMSKRANVVKNCQNINVINQRSFRTRGVRSKRMLREARCESPDLRESHSRTTLRTQIYGTNLRSQRATCSRSTGKAEPAVSMYGDNDYFDDSSYSNFLAEDQAAVLSQKYFKQPELLKSLCKKMGGKRMKTETFNDRSTESADRLKKTNVIDVVHRRTTSCDKSVEIDGITQFGAGKGEEKEGCSLERNSAAQWQEATEIISKTEFSMTKPQGISSRKRSHATHEGQTWSAKTEEKEHSTNDQTYEKTEYACLVNPAKQSFTRESLQPKEDVMYTLSDNQREALGDDGAVYRGEKEMIISTHGTDARNAFISPSVTFKSALSVSSTDSKISFLSDTARQCGNKLEANCSMHPWSDDVGGRSAVRGAKIMSVLDSITSSWHTVSRGGYQQNTALPCTDTIQKEVAADSVRHSDKSSSLHGHHPSKSTSISQYVFHGRNNTETSSFSTMRNISDIPFTYPSASPDDSFQVVVMDENYRSSSPLSKCYHKNILGERNLRSDQVICDFNTSNRKYQRSSSEPNLSATNSSSKSKTARLSKSVMDLSKSFLRAPKPDTGNINPIAMRGGATPFLSIQTNTQAGLSPAGQVYKNNCTEGKHTKMASTLKKITNRQLTPVSIGAERYSFLQKHICLDKSHHKTTKRPACSIVKYHPESVQTKPYTKAVHVDKRMSHDDERRVNVMTLASSQPLLCNDNNKYESCYSNLHTKKEKSPSSLPTFANLVKFWESIGTVFETSGRKSVEDVKSLKNSKLAVCENKSSEENSTVYYSTVDEAKMNPCVHNRVDHSLQTLDKANIIQRDVGNVQKWNSPSEPRRKSPIIKMDVDKCRQIILFLENVIKQNSGVRKCSQRAWSNKGGLTNNEKSFNSPWPASRCLYSRPQRKTLTKGSHHMRMKYLSRTKKSSYAHNPSKQTQKAFSGRAERPHGYTTDTFDKNDKQHQSVIICDSRNSVYQSITDSCTRSPVFPHRQLVVGKSASVSLQSALESTPRKTNSSQPMHDSPLLISPAGRHGLCIKKERKEVAPYSMKNLESNSSLSVYTYIPSSDKCFPISAGLDYTSDCSSECCNPVIRDTDYNTRQKRVRRGSCKPVMTDAARTNQLRNVFKSAFADAAVCRMPKLKKLVSNSKGTFATQELHCKCQDREVLTSTSIEVTYSKSMDNTLCSVTNRSSEHSYCVRRSRSTDSKWSSSDSSKRNNHLSDSYSSRSTFGKKKPVETSEQTTTDQIHSSELDTLSLPSLSRSDEAQHKGSISHKQTSAEKQISNSCSTTTTTTSGSTGTTPCQTAVHSRKPLYTDSETSIDFTETVWNKLERYTKSKKTGEITRLSKGNLDRLHPLKTNTIQLRPERCSADLNTTPQTLKVPYRIENYRPCYRGCDTFVLRKAKILDKMSPKMLSPRYRRLSKQDDRVNKISRKHENLISLSPEQNTCCNPLQNNLSPFRSRNGKRYKAHDDDLHTWIERHTLASTLPLKTSTVKRLQSKDPESKKQSSGAHKKRITTTPAETVILSTSRLSKILKSTRRLSRNIPQKFIRNLKSRQDIVRNTQSGESESGFARIKQHYPREMEISQKRSRQNTDKHGGSARTSPNKLVFRTPASVCETSPNFSKYSQPYMSPSYEQEDERQVYISRPKSPAPIFDRPETSEDFSSPCYAPNCNSKSKEMTSSSRNLYNILSLPLTASDECSQSFQNNNWARAINIASTLRSLLTKRNNIPLKSELGVCVPELILPAGNHVQLSSTPSQFQKRPGRTPFTIHCSQKKKSHGENGGQNKSQLFQESPGEKPDKIKRNTKSNFPPASCITEVMNQSEVVKVVHGNNNNGDNNNRDNNNGDSNKIWEMYEPNCKLKQNKYTRSVSDDLLEFLSFRHRWRSSRKECINSALSILRPFKSTAATDVSVPQRYASPRHSGPKGSLLECDKLQCTKETKSPEVCQPDSTGVEGGNNCTDRIQPGHENITCNHVGYEDSVSYKTANNLAGNRVIQVPENVCRKCMISVSHTKLKKNNSAPCLSVVSSHLENKDKGTGNDIPMPVSDNTTFRDVVSGCTNTGEQDPTFDISHVVCDQQKAAHLLCASQAVVVECSRPADTNYSSQRSHDIEIVLGNDIPLREFMSYLLSSLQLNNSRMSSEEGSNYASINSQVRLLVEQIIDDEHVSSVIKPSDTTETATTAKVCGNIVDTYNSETVGAHRVSADITQQPTESTAQEKSETISKGLNRNEGWEKTYQHNFTNKKQTFDDKCAQFKEKPNRLPKPGHSSVSDICISQTKYVQLCEREGKLKEAGTSHRRLAVSSSSVSVLSRSRVRKKLGERPCRSNVCMKQYLGSIHSAGSAFTQNRCPLPSAPNMNLLEKISADLTYSETLKHQRSKVRRVPEEVFTFSKPHTSHLEKVIKSNNRVALTFSGFDRMHSLRKRAMNTKPHHPPASRIIKGLNETLLEKESQIFTSKDASTENKSGSFNWNTGTSRTRHSGRVEGQYNESRSKSREFTRRNISSSGDVFMVKKQHLEGKVQNIFKGHKEFASAHTEAKATAPKTARCTLKYENRDLSLTRPPKTVPPKKLIQNIETGGESCRASCLRSCSPEGTVNGSSSWSTGQDFQARNTAKKAHVNKQEHDKSRLTCLDHNIKTLTDSNKSLPGCSNTELLENISGDIAIDSTRKLPADFNRKLTADFNRQLPGDSNNLSADSNKKVPADSSRKLSADSNRKLTADSSRKLSAYSNRKLTADSKKKLAEDSSRKLAADSSKKLAADSNRKLTADSNRKLRADSNRNLAADSNRKLAADLNKKLAAESNRKLSTSSNRVPPGKSNRNLPEAYNRTLSAEPNKKLHTDSSRKLPTESSKTLPTDTSRKLLTSSNRKYVAESKRKFVVDSTRKSPAHPHRLLTVDSVRKLPADYKLKLPVDSNVTLRSNSKETLTTAVSYDAQDSLKCSEKNLSSQIQQLVQLFHDFLSERRMGNDHVIALQREATTYHKDLSLTKEQVQMSFDSPKNNKFHVHMAPNLDVGNFSSAVDKSVMKSTSHFSSMASSEGKISSIKIISPKIAVKPGMFSYTSPPSNKGSVKVQHTEIYKRESCVQVTSLDTASSPTSDRSKTVRTLKYSQKTEVGPTGEDSFHTEPGPCKTLATSTYSPKLKLMMTLQEESLHTETTETATLDHFNAFRAPGDLQKMVLRTVTEDNYSMVKSTDVSASGPDYTDLAKVNVPSLTKAKHSYLETEPSVRKSSSSSRICLTPHPIPGGSRETLECSKSPLSPNRKRAHSPYRDEIRKTHQTSTSTTESSVHQASKIAAPPTNFQQELVSSDTKELEMQDSDIFVDEHMASDTKKNLVTQLSAFPYYNEIKVKAPCSVCTARDNINVVMSQGSEGKCVKLVVFPEDQDVPYEIVVEPESWNDGPAMVVADNGFVHVSFDKSELAEHKKTNISSEARQSNDESVTSRQSDGSCSSTTSSCTSYESCSSSASSHEQHLYDTNKKRKDTQLNKASTFDCQTETQRRKLSVNTGQISNTTLLGVFDRPTTFVSKGLAHINRSQVAETRPNDKESSSRKSKVTVYDKSIVKLDKDTLSYFSPNSKKSLHRKLRRSKEVDYIQQHENSPCNYHHLVTVSPEMFALNEVRDLTYEQSTLTKMTRSRSTHRHKSKLRNSPSDCMGKSLHKKADYKSQIQTACIPVKKKHEPAQQLRISPKEESSGDDHSSGSIGTRTDIQTEDSVSDSENTSSSFITYPEKAYYSRITSSSSDLESVPEMNCSKAGKTQLSSSRTIQRPKTVSRIPIKESPKSLLSSKLHKQIISPSNEYMKSHSGLVRKPVVKFQEPIDCDGVPVSGNLKESGTLSTKTQPDVTKRKSSEKGTCPHESIAAVSLAQKSDVDANSPIRVLARNLQQQHSPHQNVKHEKNTCRSALVFDAISDLDTNSCEDLNYLSSNFQLSSNIEENASGSFAQPDNLVLGPQIYDVSTKKPADTSRSLIKEVTDMSLRKLQTGFPGTHVLNRSAGHAFSGTTEDKRGVAGNRNMSTNQGQVRFSDQVIEYHETELGLFSPPTSQIPGNVNAVEKKADMRTCSYVAQRMSDMSATSAPPRASIMDMQPLSSSLYPQGAAWRQHPIKAHVGSRQHNQSHASGITLVTSTLRPAKFPTLSHLRPSTQGRNRTRLSRCLSKAAAFPKPWSRQSGSVQRLTRRRSSLPERAADSGYSELSTPTDHRGINLCDWDQSVRRRLQERKRHTHL